MPPAFFNRLLVLTSEFVHASFAPRMLDMRVLMALLARTYSGGHGPNEIRLPLAELLSHSDRNLSKWDYATMIALCTRLESLMLELPPVVAPDGLESPRSPLRLFAYVRYQRHRPYLRLQLSEQVRSYQAVARPVVVTVLHGQVLKLRLPTAVRIYWWLRECKHQGLRTLQIGVEDLRWQLGLGRKYPRVGSLIIRLLKPAQRELAATDLPFELGYLQQGTAIRAFCFTLLSPVDRPNRSNVADFPLPEQSQLGLFGDCLLSGGVPYWVAPTLRSLPLQPQRRPSYGSTKMGGNTEENRQFLEFKKV